MLFEMLAGECPFGGGAVTLLRQHVLTPAPPLPSHVSEAVPPEVRAMVARLLEKEASARFATAADVVAAIDACRASVVPAKPQVVIGQARLGAAEARAQTRLAGSTGLGAHAWLVRWRHAMSAIARRREAESALRAAKWLYARATEVALRANAAARRRPKAAAIAGLGLLSTLAVIAAVVSSGRSRSPGPAAVASAIATSRASPSPPPAVLAAQTAKSSSGLTFLAGAFGDHVERGQPVGDATTLAASGRAIYWIDVENEGKSTEVTLVWLIDGVEVQRQSLRVGRGPHWRTWGSRALHGGRLVAVKVFDAGGEALKEDSIRLDG
jgi:hypothetical protein